MRSKPNILLVLVDQMRYHAMGCAGNSQIHTPNLDQFASEGANMTDAVSTSPVCTPARACLLTGLYPLSHTTITNNSMLPTDIPSMGKHLKKQGYDTGYIGKWHLAGEAYIGKTKYNHGVEGYIPPGPMRHGFDYWAVHHCTHAYWNSCYYRDEPEPIQIDGWEPDAQTDLALEFMRENAKKEEKNPFALVVSWGTPHTPFTAPEEQLALYQPDKLQLRQNVRLEPDLLKRAESGIPEGMTDPEAILRMFTHNYYAAVSNIDHNFGRLLDELKTLGIEDDTLVVFTSDHGEMLGSHGQFSKTQAREESIRIPMLVRYPNVVEKGRRYNSPFSLTDALPTMLGLADLPNIDDAEGCDFSPMLRGEFFKEPSSSFITWPCSATTWGKRWTPCTDEFRGYEKGFMREYRAVRTRTHTYARYPDAPWMLYDNENDPYQLDNLIESKGANFVPPELERELEEWLERTGDDFRTTEEYMELIDLETGLVRDRRRLKRC